MERQSTSKLFRALIAVVAFFVLCTSAILFASCGTDPKECEHDTDGKLVAVTQATCGHAGTLTYECSKCGAEVTVTGTLATGEHKWVNGRCSVCGIEESSQEDLTLQQLKDDLTNVLNTISGKVDTASTNVNGLTQKIVEALQSADFTIPSLKTQLEDIKASLDALDFDFDIGDIQLVADSSNGSTLGEVISSLYKQVNALYSNYAGENKQSLYDLLVGGTGATAHVHNWVLKLKKDTTYSCTAPNTYVWGCAFCDEVKEGDVTVMATGHATEFKTGLTAEGHHFDATCITPERVEGYCANCKEWTGEWTEVGQPTYKHHYVLETGENADGEAGTHGSCTSVHQNVYHCETCGGAYIEETASSGEHNYYYVEQEDGTKRPMTEEEKLAVWKAAHSDSTIKSLDELTVSEVQELNELLKEDHLNVVYYSAPTCVDPSLIVVECMECGVRYAYTFGQPDEHVFTQVEPEKDSTCTMAGTRDYYHCEKCGYYFFFEDGDLVKENGKVKVNANKEAEVSSTRVSLKYTRKYMTDANGKVINDKNGTNEEKAAAAAAAYAMATAADPADGHNFVPVYINTEKCVTAQDYILVCTKCFTDGTHSFNDLVQVGTADGTGKLFYQEATGKPYYLKGLSGDNVTDPLANLLKGVTDKATADDPATKTSDLSAEWTALDKEDKVSVFAWLGAHGYLVRDAKDDELFNISVATATAWYENGALKEAAKATIQGYLDKLGTLDLATLYSGYSVVTSKASNVLNGNFELPVVGHKFNDKFVTVIANCVMYERHQYFCSVCGQQTGDPAATTDTSGKVVVEPPYKSVNGDSDLYTAGYKTTAPEGTKTDLRKSWDEVCALEDSDGSEQMIWLVKYGYLNDYRDSARADWSNVDPKLGATGLSEDEELMPQLMELMRIQQRMGVIASSTEEMDLADFFTEENILGQFEVTWTLGSNRGSNNDAQIVLGHKFDVVTLIGEDQNCTAPGQYVYVCSVCGLQTGATKSDLQYQSGANSVKTGLKAVDVNKTNFQSDNDLFEAAIAEENRGEGKTYTKTDLQLEWDALNAEGKTENDRFEWLLAKGYLNNVIDTYFTKDLDQIHTQADYNEKKAAIYGSDGNLTSDAKAAVLAKAKELAKTATYTLEGGTEGDISVYYTKSANTFKDADGNDVKDTPANKTIDFAATTIPQAGHLYTKGDGTPFDRENDPLCTDFQDKTLTDLYNAGKIAKWNDTTKKWVDSGKTFNKEDLDPEFRTQADTYGILAACKRDNCPLHSKDTIGTEKFTAGYIAAQDHEIVYEKFAAFGSESEYAGTPSPKVEDYTTPATERTHYNMKTADAYKDGEKHPVEIGGDPVAITDTNKQAAMDADTLNLYTLQKIYNYQHIDAETLAAHPELEFLKVEKGVEKGQWTQDWMPLTRSLTENKYDTPSCWIAVRCKWYHNPVKGADGTLVEGTKCNQSNGDTPHTLPKSGDWNYSDNDANCQHGNLCIVCGRDMSTKTGHNLVEVSTLGGITKTYWKQLFREKYTGSHFGLEIGSQAVVNGVTKTIETEDELWDAIEEKFCAPTCCDDGHKIYICTGELGVYGKAKEAGEPVEFNAIQETQGLVKDKWNHNVGTSVSNATYYVQKVARTGDHNYKTYYFKSGTAETDLKIANAIDAATWNNGFNKLVCLEGYIEVEICTNEHRDAVDLAAGQKQCEDHLPPIVHEAPQHTFAPQERYWEKVGRFEPATENKNAVLEHVCVICGFTMYGEYGSFTGDGQYNVQYVGATKEQIDRWNAIGTPDPSYEKAKINAQLVRTQDVVKDVVNTHVVSGTILDGVNVVKGNEATLTGETYLYVGSENGGTTLLAPEAKLTLKVENGTIGVRGNYAFVGEVEDGKALPTLTLTAQSVSLLDGITFENLNVVLGDTLIANRAQQGGNLTFKNCTVTSNDTPFAMNASWGYGGTVTIEDSTFISSNDVGFAVWDPNTTVTATKSTFVGKLAGAFIRSGNATFTECTFVTEGTKGTHEWGEGTQINVTGALVIGNGSEAAGYGNAHVTLENCKFGTYSGEYVATAELGACTADKPAVNAFSSKVNETVVDFDAQSAIAANGFIQQHPATGVNTLTVKFTVPTAQSLGANQGEQATNAAALIKSVATAGGVLELPASIGNIAITDQLNVPAGKEFTLTVGTGNTLKPSANVVPQGKLTIKGGTVDVANHLLAVTSDNAELTLDGVTVNAAAGSNSALYVQAGKLTVTNSTIVTNDVGFMTNHAQTTSATVKMSGTTLISKSDVAVLINTLGSYTFENCTFYGQQVGAWVRGTGTGEADSVSFTGCKFYTGNTAMAWLNNGTTWGVGSTLPKTVIAALLVGNGNDAYGNVKAVNVANSTFGIATLSGNTVNPASSTWGTAQPFVAALYGEQTLSVKFDKASYDALGTSYKLTTEEVKAENGNITTAATLLLYNNANASQATVAYTEGTTENKVSPEVVLTADNLETAAKAAITDVAANGGKVVLPQQEAATTVTLEGPVAVAEGKSVEIALNGNTLKLLETQVEGSGLRSGLSVTGTLVLDGGKVEGQLSVGQAADVSIKNVELVHPEAEHPEDQSSFYGITVNSAQASTAKLTVENSSVSALIPLYINGNDDGATIELKNSDFIGVDGHGCWLAGDATVTATDCNFYGSVYAVQVCSGDVTFNNCNFMTTGDSFGTEVKETIQYGGPSIPSSINAPLVINAKGSGYDIAKVTVNGGNFYNIDAQEGDTIKYKPEDVFTTPVDTAGYTEIKSMADSSKTIGWVKLSTEDRCDISLAYVKNQATGKLTLAVTGIETLVVNAFVFTVDKPEQMANVTVETVWETATYFTVTGCTLRR